MLTLGLTLIGATFSGQQSVTGHVNFHATIRNESNLTLTDHGGIVVADATVSGYENGRFVTRKHHAAFLRSDMVVAELSGLHAVNRMEALTHR